MDVFEAMKERRSSRNFLPEPIEDKVIEQILEAATWAPSPLNLQPWEFVVVTNQETKEKIFNEADKRRQWGLEKSGWKWLGKYQVDFLKSAPALVMVVGNPKKSGLDTFQEDGPIGYQQACAAAIQNMQLAAHALGLGSLWFTLFDKNEMRGILDIPPEKVPLGLVCLGKAGGDPTPAPRKAVSEKTTFV